MKSNLKIITTAVIIFSLGLVALMIRWQIIDHEKWQARAQSQYLSEPRAPSSRGVIYASDGTTLAIDEPAWGVYASLSSKKKERELFFNGKEKFIAEVAGVLEINKEQLEKKLDEDFRYVNIAHGVSSEKVKALKEAEIFTPEEMRKANLPAFYRKGFGLYFQKEEKRVYPDGNLASHVIGFMGKDEEGQDIGRYGIEGYYFTDMTAQEARSKEETDSKGDIILTVEYEPVVYRGGKSVYLTIDTGIQSKVQKKLQENVEKHKAKSGTAIIMEPSTGKIIAMANYPDYNPNEYWRVSNPEIFKNKAIGDRYEPGSVQKPISMAIALESGEVPEDWICHDETGFIELYDRKIYTWDKKPDGDLSLSEILEYSSNPCIAQVALMPDPRYYYDKLKEFGYGGHVGLGLQDEVSGYINPFRTWTKLDVAATSFGQSLLVSPIQMIGYTNVIANDGKNMRPYVVSKVEDNVETIEFQPNQINTPISKETADRVTDMMVETAEHGAIEKILEKSMNDSKAYKIAGKTGTAQIARRDSSGYYKSKMNTTFVGFAPAYKPKMIMLVKLEEPQSSNYATETAVPTWGKIFDEIANDLEIPKEN